MMSFMLTDAIRRAEAALDEVLVHSKSGQASTGDLRRGLEAFKSMRAKLDACQTHAAGSLASRERHGDGGAGVLAQAAGLSRREAVGQVKTAERLRAMPDVQQAVESGRVSFANAKALADASEKVSAGAVAEDSELLAKASSLPPEQFAREAGRWAAQRQDDGGETAWRRLRRRRRLSVWDGDDGMVHLRGEFDPVTGAKLHKRLNEHAERLRREDLALSEAERRSRHQRMADALEALTGGGTDTAGGTDGGAGRRASRRADIAIVQHLSADGTRDFAEIAGGAVIPQSVLEEHMCNARVAGIVFSHKGVPLWHGHTKTIATEAQFRALIAKYGGCAGCGAPPLLCQAHHIEPVSQGGATDITNMIPLCWHCHQKVHHHGWKVVPDARGLRTIEPPDRIHYGPARAPETSPADDGPPRPARSGGQPARAPGRSPADDGSARLAGLGGQPARVPGRSPASDGQARRRPPRRNGVSPRAGPPQRQSPRAGPPRGVGTSAPRAPSADRRETDRPRSSPVESGAQPNTQLQLTASHSQYVDPQRDHQVWRRSR